MKWKDFIKDPYQKGIANKPLEINCTCGVTFTFKQVKGFKKRDLWEALCPDCYMRKRCYNNEEWIKKNREAQLVSQNKPEQKIKNAEGVSRSWTKKKRAKESSKMKNRWKNASEEEKERMLNPLSWTSVHNDRFEEIISKSRACGGFYKGLKYDSLLELSFLLSCEERGLKVERYNLPAIKYKDETGKGRSYHPDFILNNRFVIEIKGHIWDKQGGKKRIDKKEEYARFFAKNYGMGFRMFHNSKFLKQKESLAKTIHENQAENS